MNNKLTKHLNQLNHAHLDTLLILFLKFHNQINKPKLTIINTPNVRTYKQTK